MEINPPQAAEGDVSLEVTTPTVGGYSRTSSITPISDIPYVTMSCIDSLFSGRMNSRLFWHITVAECEARKRTKELGASPRLRLLAKALNTSVITPQSLVLGPLRFPRGRRHLFFESPHELL